MHGEQDIVTKLDFGKRSINMDIITREIKDEAILQIAAEMLVKGKISESQYVEEVKPFIKDLVAYIDNLEDTNITFRTIDTSGKTKEEFYVKYFEVRGYEKNKINNIDFYQYKPYNKKFTRNIVLDENDRLLICICHNPKDIQKDEIREKFILETDPSIDYDRFTKTFDLKKDQTGKIIEITAPFRIESIFLNVISLWSEMDDNMMMRINEFFMYELGIYKKLKGILEREYNGQFVAITYDGKILASSNGVGNLLTKLKDINYPNSSEIFIKKVGKAVAG